MPFDRHRQSLQESAGNLRCSEVKQILEELGFRVRDGKKGGHKLYTHPRIKEFFGSSYNCGHGSNPEVKKPYIRKILRVLDTYESEIRDYLKGRANV